MTILAPTPESTTTTDASFAAQERTWHAVCRLDDLIPHRGVAVLVEGHAVAIFRMHDDEVRAIGNIDPYAGASVLARGLVGHTLQDGDLVTYVASPLRKQRFDLDSGRGIDGTRDVATWPVRVGNGDVMVASEASHGGNDPETSA